jgi:hypothetical protein
MVHRSGFSVSQDFAQIGLARKLFNDPCVRQ